MKISVITVVYNGKNTIEECIKSVVSQSYSDLEYIIVDGGSRDGTLGIINSYKDNVRWISGQDKGIYDAMNKGIALSTGDVIGFLNSDDFYADNSVIKDVAEAFLNSGADSSYADLEYVDKYNTGKVVRLWKAGAYSKDRFRRGWMPPHPTFFVKKGIYEKYGYLNLNFPLAADYELMLRFLYKYNVSTTYIPRVLVKMRMGGTSKPGMYTLESIRENYRAWKANGLKYPFTLLLKPFLKIMQFVNKRKALKVF